MDAGTALRHPHKPTYQLSYQSVDLLGNFFPAQVSTGKMVIYRHLQAKSL
eukprot:SAG11_NODE_171_length_13596_cov_15.767356_1_plen_50_part_00